MKKIVLCSLKNPVPAAQLHNPEKPVPYSGLIIILLFITVIIWPSTSSAEVTWYFNWYCAGCSKIGARTTGTEGPFSSQSACESARSSMKSSMSRQGGGVDTMPCYSRGYESSTPQPSRPSVPRDSGSGQYSAPQYDNQENLMRQQREEELKRKAKEAENEKKKRDEEAKKKFEEDKQNTLKMMKGGASEFGGVKGGESDTLEIKSGTKIFGTTGNPEAGLKTGSGMTEEARRAAIAWGCAAYIAGYVFPAAKSGDVGELRYLMGQVNKVLSGGKAEVDCPVKEPPDVKGVAIGPDSPQLKFYSTLLAATAAQAEKLKEANKQLEGKDIEKLEQELRAQEKKSQKAKADAAGTKKGKEGLKKEEEAKLETEKKDEGALAEALAALKRAKEANGRIDELEGLHRQAQSDPARVEMLIDKIK